MWVLCSKVWVPYNAIIGQGKKLMKCLPWKNGGEIFILKHLKIQYLKRLAQRGTSPSFYICVIKCVVVNMFEFTVNEASYILKSATKLFVSECKVASELYCSYRCNYFISLIMKFSEQALTSQRLVHTCFLKITFLHEVSMCMCLCMCVCLHPWGN